MIDQKLGETSDKNKLTKQKRSEQMNIKNLTPSDYNKLPGRLMMRRRIVIISSSDSSILAYTRMKYRNG
jgi:hypothetical protein